ncbi:MAG: hypothetical protein ABIA47_00805 [bacterium]
MLAQAALAILFIAGILLQASLVSALTSPFSYIPLMIALAIVIMHRGQIVIGSAWLVLTGLALPLFGFADYAAWTYFAIAIIAPVLSIRFFTTRSVYALAGLGAAVYIIFSLLNFLHLSIIYDFDFEQFSQSFWTARLYSLTFLIISIYFFFLAARYLEYLSSTVFLVRQR